MRRAAERFGGGFEIVERIPHGGANVKAAALRAHVPLAVPAAVPVHLVRRVEAFLKKARRQTERHRRVVGPLAGLKMKRTSAHHIEHRHERTARLELNRRSHRVATGQTKQSSAKTILCCQCHFDSLCETGITVTDHRQCRLVNPLRNVSEINSLFGIADLKHRGTEFTEFTEKL